jgi:hypothetical protein
LFERERHSEPVPAWHSCDLGRGCMNCQIEFAPLPDQNKLPIHIEL